MLGVAIVPPHLTVLSMRMAVALYVTGISTPEVRETGSPPRISTTSRDVNCKDRFSMIGNIRLSFVLIDTEDSRILPAGRVGGTASLHGTIGDRLRFGIDS